MVIKVSVKDNNTLVLKENGNTGDEIDLRQVSVDTSSIEAQISVEKDKIYREKLESFQKRVDLEKSIVTSDYESKIKILTREAEAKSNSKLQEQELAFKQQISSLKSIIDKAETEKSLAVSKIVSKNNEELSVFRAEMERKVNEKELEIQKLQSLLDTRNIQAKNNENGLIMKYEEQLKEKDVQIDFYKNLKIQMSTKMLGETLEQHCENSYNMYVRPYKPEAYFEKDNDARTGSKADYIFRDFINGIETVSIIFDMKNEADATKTKHKNEHYFAELDKDRKEKNCEYAVLVSTLEKDNENYNQGIVDVSYKYPKMYVVRPQLFLSIISILSNAHQNVFGLKKELEIAKCQSIGGGGGEVKLNNFISKIGKNYELADKKFKDAINGIEDTITILSNVKDALLNCGKNLRLANDKAESLTIKKLTKESPSLALQFEKAKAANQ